MEVVSSLVVNVVDSLFSVAKNEISHMWNYSEHVENLNKETENLRVIMGLLEQRIDDAKGKGEVPKKDMEMWMTKANDTISETEKFLAEAAESKKCCNLRFCVNLGALYHYGKRATKKVHSLLQLQKEGKDFETCVFLHLPSPVFTDLYQRKNLDSIYTQKATLNDIIEAIKDDTIQIVGITGLGGVGKTTLAYEVAKEMKNQFADIVFITVSKNIDTEMIKKKVQVAAKRIIQKEKKEKVLIILDDVWDELKLGELDIPCGSDYMNCKILLTCRDKDVCEAMCANKIIYLKPLQEEEAWSLFEHVVDKSEWDDTLEEVARKIVEECGGLPLFIQAVGKALKNKKTQIWEAVLRRLQSPFNGDATYKREGLLQLKLSYDYLENEVAKSCFLLCSMFPEDEIIRLKTLIYYGLGLGILNNPNSIQDAKDRVLLAVESLKSSFLLLPVKKYNQITEKEEEEEEEEYRMHDLVRDMALFITSEGNNKVLVQSKQGLIEWRPRNDFLKSYKRISLMGNKICKLPNQKLVFPCLDTFLIQDNDLSIIPNEFFQGMEKLRVLDMSDNDISSLPQSIKQLTILHTLDLSGNKSIHEISILGGLTCLEILKLSSTGITKIPEEIGQLINLRLLDVNYCEDLSYITPGVISKLILLEELYVWLIKDEGSYEFLVEVSESQSLKILHLRVPLLDFIPEDSHFETLIEFRFQDKPTKHNLAGSYKRTVQVSSYNYPFTMPVMKLIQVSEALQLWDIKNLDNILPELYPEGFEKLKYIELRECETIRSLVRTCDLDSMQNLNEPGQRKTNGSFFSQLKEIELHSLKSLEALCDSPHQCINFRNLTIIKIESCPSLRKLFPVSVAQGLVNLRAITIMSCESLVVVISAGDEQTTGSEIEQTEQCETEQTGGSEIREIKHDTNIVFPLTHVDLRKLPKLESFYSGHSIVEYPLLKYLDVEDCPRMKRWSYAKSFMPHISLNYILYDSGEYYPQRYGEYGYGEYGYHYHPPNSHLSCSDINERIAEMRKRNENFQIHEPSCAIM